MNRSTTDVCVVGFHAETERTHLQTVRDICSKTDRAPKVLGFTVHGHKDLGSIPDAKVYIMFVDFNQRNIILEDPQKGLGDIRLETVRQLWRLGGKQYNCMSVRVCTSGRKGNVYLTTTSTHFIYGYMASYILW